MGKAKYLQLKWRMILVTFVLLAICSESISYKVYANSYTIHMQPAVTSSGQPLQAPTCHSLDVPNSEAQHLKTSHIDKQNTNTSHKTSCCDPSISNNSKCANSYSCELDCNHCLTIAVIANIFSLHSWQQAFLPSPQVSSTKAFFSAPRLHNPFRPPIV